MNILTTLLSWWRHATRQSSRRSHLVRHYSPFWINYASLTFLLGCAHQQQIIWQLFNAVEKGYAASGDNDEAFLKGT